MRPPMNREHFPFLPLATVESARSWRQAALDLDGLHACVAHLQRAQVLNWAAARVLLNLAEAVRLLHLLTLNPKP